MENNAQWQFDYLTVHQGINSDSTVLDLSNGILTLADILIPYLDNGNYQGNVVKKMTIRPEVDTAPIDNNSDKNPHLDIIQNFNCTVTQPVDVAWEHNVFCHLAVYDAMLCLANVGKVSDRFLFSYHDQESAPPQHINQNKSHPEVKFYYTQSQIVTMCKHTGWKVSPASEQNHPDGLITMEAVKA